MGQHACLIAVVVGSAVSVVWVRELVWQVPDVDVSGLVSTLAARLMNSLSVILTTWHRNGVVYVNIVLIEVRTTSHG